MNTIHKPEAVQFVHLFCEGSILFSCVLGLALVVALGAWAMEMLSSTF